MSAPNDANDINLVGFLLKSTYYHLFSKQIFAHHNSVVRGLHNIDTSEGTLYLGKRYVGFLHGGDTTFVNVHPMGRLIIKGEVHIGKGCRVNVAKGGVCILNNCSVTGMSTLVVKHNLEIGPGSVIAWDCQLLDEDWHLIEYEDQRQIEGKGIRIGQHVWIGNSVIILKGVDIGDGAVVGAGSLVTRSIPESCLVAGNPAKVIRHEIKWS